jgi:hypothetical protein
MKFPTGRDPPMIAIKHHHKKQQPLPRLSFLYGYIVRECESTSSVL